MQVFIDGFRNDLIHSISVKPRFISTSERVVGSISLSDMFLPSNDQILSLPR